MNRKTVFALLGAITITVGGTGAALASTQAGPAVRVQIKTTTRTLRDVIVHGEKGWITKDGMPRGVCPGDSAAGALDAATHGHWSGKYYAKYRDILVERILGVKPKAPDYWGFFVNGRMATVGVCAVKLRPHQQLVFKVVK
jgi:hypothetical protein